MNIRERLGKELLFLDGGMGTLLQAEGLAPGELPETWNIEHPEKVEAIHRRYYEAGSDVVLANTFGANVCKFHEKIEHHFHGIGGFAHGRNHYKQVFLYR